MNKKLENLVYIIAIVADLALAVYVSIPLFSDYLWQDRLGRGAMVLVWIAFMATAYSFKMAFYVKIDNKIKFFIVFFLALVFQFHWWLIDVNFHWDKWDKVTTVTSPSGRSTVYIKQYQFFFYCEQRVETHHFRFFKKKIERASLPQQDDVCIDYDRVKMTWSKDERSIHWKVEGDVSDIPSKEGTIQLNTNSSTD